VADGLHHAADLAIAALVDRHLDDPGAAIWAASDLAYLRGSGRFAASDIQAACQRLQSIVGDRALDGDEVGLAHRL
jgi:hypothetical protein